MSSNLTEAGFAFIMAIAFAIIGLRAAKVRSDRLALWNSARNWPTVSAKLLEVGVDVVTKVMIVFCSIPITDRGSPIPIR